MISLGQGLRTTLSGRESKSMTHFLRLHHDAILIGIGTLRADNPSLNCRYPGVTLEQQPRPIVVGSSDMFSEALASKIGELYFAGKGKSPWHVVPHNDVSMNHPTPRDSHFIHLHQTVSDCIPWRDILEEMADRGIKSIMIEGGATVINALLQRPSLVDSVIITIAPTFLGKDGVQVSPAVATPGDEPQNAANLEDVQYCQFGRDMVLCGRLGRSQ